LGNFLAKRINTLIIPCAKANWHSKIGGEQLAKLFISCRLFEIGENKCLHGETGGRRTIFATAAKTALKRKLASRRVKVVYSECDLLQVVGTLHPPCRLACRLNGREEQADEDADDCDNDQEFDQGES
jgi:hypothetical protein